MAQVDRQSRRCVVVFRINENHELNGNDPTIDAPVIDTNRMNTISQGLEAEMVLYEVTELHCWFYT
jgi:hypothetical protein